MCAKSNYSSDKKNCFVFFHAEAFSPFFMLSGFSCQCTLHFYVSCCRSRRTSDGLTNWSHLFSNTAARRHAAVTDVPPLPHHISVSVTRKQHRRSLDRGDPSAVAMAQGRHEY